MHRTTEPTKSIHAYAKRKVRFTSGVIPATSTELPDGRRQRIMQSVWITVGRNKTGLRHLYNTVWQKENNIKGTTALRLRSLSWTWEIQFLFRGLPQVSHMIKVKEKDK